MVLCRKKNLFAYEYTRRFCLGESKQCRLLDEDMTDTEDELLVDQLVYRSEKLHHYSSRDLSRLYVR